MAEVRRSHREDANSRYLTALIHRERDDGASAIRALGRFSAQDPEMENIRKLVSSVKERLPRSGRQIAEYAGHTGSVNAVRFGSGGRWAVSGGDDGEIRLWNLPKRTVLRRLTGHRGPVRGLALSGNGRVLVSGGGDYLSRDFVLRVWDAAQGDLVAELGGHEKQINAVDVDGTGRLALSAGEDQTLRIWDLAGKKQVWGLDAGAPVHGASFSPSGRYALTGGTDRTIRLWDVEAGRKAAEFKGHENRVTALCFLADDRWFVSGGGGGRLRFWDAKEGREVRAMSGHEGEVLAVRCFGPRKAVTAGADFTVRLWDLKSGRCLRTFEGHKSWVGGLDSLPGKPFVLSGGVDSTMRLWRVEEPPATAAAPMALSRVSSSETVATARENYESFLGAARESLAAGQAGPAARAAREARGQPGYDRAAEAVSLWSKLYLHLPRGGFRGGWERPAIGEIRMEAPIVALDRRGERLIRGGRDGAVRLWRTEDAVLLKTWADHREKLYAATFSPDGTLAATAGRGGRIRLWRTRADFEAGPALEHGAPVHALGFSSDGRHLFSGGEDRTVRVWEIETGRQAGEIGGHRGTVNDLAVSLDGRLLLTGAGDYTGEGSGIFVRDAATGRKLKELMGHERSVEAVRFGPGGRTVVSGGADGLVKVWDVETGECRATLTGHEGPVKSVSLSLDGRIILSAGSDGTLRLWDRAEGRELRTFGGHGGPVASAALAFHGGMAVSGGADGLVRVWFLDWDLKDPPSEAWDRRAERLIGIFAASRRPYRFAPEPETEAPEDFPYIADPDGETIEELIYWLGAAGLGWVDPRRALDVLAGPPKVEAPSETPSHAPAIGPKKSAPGLFARLKSKLTGS
jgi:WD40 repeat protein